MDIGRKWEFKEKETGVLVTFVELRSLDPDGGPPVIRILRADEEPGLVFYAKTVPSDVGTEEINSYLANTDRWEYLNGPPTGPIPDTPMW